MEPRNKPTLNCRSVLAEKKNQDGKEEKSSGCSVQAGEDNVKEKPHNDCALNQPAVTQSDSSISIKLNLHDKIHSVSTLEDTFK